jgi:ssDNA-binding Zn-finger/Zn-ribbon topoisomerase 1
MVRKKIIHECARCGTQMEYRQKRMLYIYDIREYPKTRYGNYAIIRPTATLKLNLCPDCARLAAAILEREGFMNREESSYHPEP